MKQQYDEVWIGDDARCYRYPISRDTMAGLIKDRDKDETYINHSDLGLAILRLSGVAVHCFLKREISMDAWIHWR